MTTSISTHSNCANCKTRQTTEWRDLNAHELKSLDHAKRTRTITPGTSLYHQGDLANGVYCIQSGLIGLRHVDVNGNSSLIKTCSEGTTVGYQAFLSNEPYSSSAEVLIGSEVCFIEGSAITRLLAENPKLGERFLHHSFKDLNELEGNYTRNMTMNAKSRFLHMLMVFFQQHGFQDSDGTPSVDIPVTRADMAELLGVQPESMSRTVKKVQDEGLVVIDNRRVTIVDMEGVLYQAGATL